MISECYDFFKKSIFKVYIIYFIVSSVTISLSYSSTLWIDAAYHDNTRYFSQDITLINKSDFKCRYDSQYGWLKIIGRPVTAEIECKISKYVNSLTEIKWAKFLTILVIALSSSMLATMFYLNGIGKVSSLLFSLSVFSLPGIQNAVFMTNIPNAVAIFLSLLAGGLLLRSKKLKKISKKNVFVHGGVGVLLILSGMTYPLMSFSFFIIIFIKLILNKCDFVDKIKEIIYSVVVFVISMILSLIFSPLFIDNIFLNSIKTIPQEYSPDYNVVSIIQHVPNLFYHVIPTVLGLWFSDYYSVSLFINTIFFISVAIFIIVFRKKDLLIDLFVFSFFLLLIISPILLINSGSPTLHQRMIFPSEAIFLIFMFLTSIRMLRFVIRDVNLLQYLTNTYAFIFLSIGLLYASYSITENVINSNLEMNFVRVQMSKYKELPTSIHLVQAIDNNLGFNGIKSQTDEFNQKTTNYPQDIVNFISLSLYGGRDFFPIKKLFYCDPNVNNCEAMSFENKIPVSYSAYGQKFCTSSGMALIDMNVLVRATGTGNPDLVTLKDMPKCIYPQFKVSSNYLRNERHLVSKAFDSSTSPDSFWETSIKKPILYITYKNKSVLRSYTFSSGEDPSRMPTDWALFGSNDDHKWVILDKRVGQLSFKKNENRIYELYNINGYRNYKIEFYKYGVKNILRIYEIELN